jgi:hypothetical protein
MPQVRRVFAEDKDVTKNFILKSSNTEVLIARSKLTSPYSKTCKTSLYQKSKQQKSKTFIRGRIPKYNSNMEV